MVKGGAGLNLVAIIPLNVYTLLAYFVKTNLFLMMIFQINVSSMILIVFDFDYNSH